MCEHRKPTFGCLDCIERRGPLLDGEALRDYRFSQLCEELDLMMDRVYDLPPRLKAVRLLAEQADRIEPMLEELKNAQDL